MHTPDNGRQRASITLAGVAGDRTTDVDNLDDADTVVQIHDLTVPDPDLVGLLRTADPDQWAGLTIEALHVGVLGLRTVTASGESHLVRDVLGKVEATLTAVEQTALARATESGQAVLDKMFTDLTSDGAPLDRLLKQMDPDSATGVLNAIRQVTSREVAAANQAQREELGKQMTAIMGQATKTLTETMADIKAEIAAQAANRQMFRKTTAVGRDFEETLEGCVGSVLSGTSDTVEHVGDVAGVEGTKKGDLLLRLDIDGHEHRVVIEAKAADRSRPKILAEASEAIANRDAELCLWVTDTLDRVPGHQPLVRLDEDVIVVCLDAEEPDPTALAIAVAQTRLILAQRVTPVTSAADESVHAALSEAWQKLQRLQDTLRQFSQLKSGHTAVRKGLEASTATAAQLEQELKEGLRDLTDGLAAVLDAAQADGMAA